MTQAQDHQLQAAIAGIVEHTAGMDFATVCAAFLHVLEAHPAPNDADLEAMGNRLGRLPQMRARGLEV